MWRLSTILVPTDFGPIAELAFDAAIDLAKKFDASIVVLHAFLLPTYAYPAFSGIPAMDLATPLEEAAREALAAQIESRRQSGVTLTAVLRAGVAWEEILAVGKLHKAGLIVMGSHGRRGLPRALLGSVAEKIVRLSPVPVLTLHGPVEGAPQSTVAPASGPLIDPWTV